VTTDIAAYRQQLVFALRMYDVPATRIGEAVAEVESHLADTGEDPVGAFGEPAEYARELSRSNRGPRTRWTGYAVGVVSFAATAVGTSALLNGRPLPAAGAALALVVLAAWLHRTRDRHRIVDPRTGAALTLPVPRWAFVAMAVALTGLVAAALVL
jgi:hypothetical protein